MILLVTASVNGPECASALSAAAQVKTELAVDVRGALNRLRETEFRAVVIDESISDIPAGQLDVLLKHVGTAVPVFVNLAISRKERVVRDVLIALRRLDQEKEFAKRSVEFDLRCQLKADLTGILLAAQQALAAGPPNGADAKIKTVCELAERMRLRLSAEPSH